MAPPSNTPLRVLIVDDEPPARERLADLLAEHSSIQIVGEAEHVEEAVALCRKYRPDALFLDIEMGETNGFSLLDALELPLPGVVFVTAHDDFTLKAFDIDAVDYLLKPVHPARLAQSIEKLERFLRAKLSDDVMLIRCDNGLTSLSLQSITHIETDGNYTRVHLDTGGSLHVRRSLQAWSALLPPAPFVQVHRSLIVNLNTVKTLQSQSRNSGELALKGGKVPIMLTRRAMQRLRRLLS